MAGAAADGVRVRAGWIFASLLAGLASGLTVGLAVPSLAARLLAVAEPTGALWLNALQMTIVPLVASLLFTGIAQTVKAAQAGRLARRALLLFLALLTAGASFSALLTPTLLALAPIPAGAAEAMRHGLKGAEPGPVPGIAAFLGSLIPANIVAAAADGAVLPLIVFMAVFALAAMRLPEYQRLHLTGLFEAVAGAMLVVIGWVLALAPIGVFALSFAVAARSGTAAIGALAHYVAVVTIAGACVLAAAYGVAVAFGRQRLPAFARAMLPAQAVALSTQSSLASLPAMLGVCRTLGVRASTADLVLPLAVALFRATGPAMNLAVAIYVARWFGILLTPGTLVAGVAVATLTTLGAVSLPGAVSFVTSIGPIALTMGVPVAPLALLIAVELFPDLMRTLGNVTMDVAVTTAVDRAADPDAG